MHQIKVGDRSVDSLDLYVDRVCFISIKFKDSQQVAILKVGQRGIKSWSDVDGTLWQMIGLRMPSN